MLRSFNTSGPCIPGKHHMLLPERRLHDVLELIEACRYFTLHGGHRTGKTTSASWVTHPRATVNPRASGSSPHAIRADGSVKVIQDPAAGGRAGTVCMCLSQEEYDSFGTPGDRFEIVGFPEEGTLLEEYNELGYDECKRLVALMEGVGDDECLEFYEGGLWLKDIYWARSIWANGKPPGFTCAEP